MATKCHFEAFFAEKSAQIFVGNDHLADRPLILAYRSGNRSQVACEQVAAQGFRVTNLVGDILGWHQQNLPFQH